MFTFRKRLKKKRNKRLHPSKSFIIRTQHPSLDARKAIAEDDALRANVAMVESSSDNWHPTGRHFFSPLKILLGILHTAFRNTHAYLQPEKQEDIVEMLESYLSMLTLFYSLVGVAAVELSMEPVDLADNVSDNSFEVITASISRAGWFALGPICLTAVAASIHSLWSIQAVPVHKRRRHLLRHQFHYSLPYAVAPPTFLILHISIFSASASSVAQAPNAWFKYTGIVGMVIGFLPILPLVYTSGAMIEDAFRPWVKGATIQNIYKNKNKTQPTVDDDGINYNASATDTTSVDLPGHKCTELHRNLQELGLGFCEELIELEGLNWETMQNICETTQSFLLIDRMLESAGIAKAGHRCEIILRLQKNLTKAM
eukprot:g2604.t1